MSVFITSSSSQFGRRRGWLAATVLWTLQIAAAAMFLFAGSHKLNAAPEMVATFEVIGLGQWFRYMTGAIEVVAAIALLVPRAAVFGALLLVPTMVGAVVTHLVIGGSIVPAVVLLGVTAFIAWARREDLLRVAAALQAATIGPGEAAIGEVR